jgi:hypothetical protein
MQPGMQAVPVEHVCLIYYSCVSVQQPSPHTFAGCLPLKAPAGDGPQGVSRRH